MKRVYLVILALICLAFLSGCTALQQDRVEYHHNALHYGELDESRSESFVLHKKNSTHYEITPNGTISAEKIEELKSILTNKSSAMTPSEYNNIIRERVEKDKKLVRRRYQLEQVAEYMEENNITSEERKRLNENTTINLTSKNLDDIRETISNINEEIRNLRTGEYEYEDPELRDSGRFECVLEFTHHSTSYHVTSKGEECGHDAWEVSNGEETYVIFSERVTQILGEIRTEG